MNKENSIGIENEPSTEINDSLKSYSSRFKQLRGMKSQTKNKVAEVLPYRLQKAAIVIQRYWRFRTIMKEQMQAQNQIVEFQNKTLDNLIAIYQKDCMMLDNCKKMQAKNKSQQNQQKSNQMVKSMVGLTMKMQKKMFLQNDIDELQEQRRQLKSTISSLQLKKNQLRNLLSGKLHDEEEDFLRRIKQQNIQLLRVSKQRNDCQKHMRQKLIQTCKAQIKI